MRAFTLFALRAALSPTVGLVLAGCITEESNPAVPLKDGGTQDGSVRPDGGAEGGGKPGIDLTTTSVDFGLQDCGSTPAAKTFTVKNSGSAPLTYSAKLDSAASFTLTGTVEGTVAPGGAASISLSAKAVPTNVAAALVISDKVVVTTNVPGLEKVDVPVTLTTQGGTLVVTPAKTSFGQVQLTVQAPEIALDVKNTGNKAVDVTLTPPTNTDYAASWATAPTAVTVAPGASLPGAVARFRPTTAGLVTANFTATGAGTLCQAAPATAAITGEGVTAQVLVSPVPLDFHTTSCGTQAVAQKVTINNKYSFPITYTATLGRTAQSDSPYTISQGAAGTVPANGSTDVTVAPQTVRAEAQSLVANALNDTLTIASPDAPGFTQTSIAITQKGSGAILALAMPTTDFGNVTVGSLGSLPISVTNSGNLDANVNVTTSTAGSSSSVFVGGLTGTGNVVAASTTRAGTVAITPAASGLKTGTVSVTTSTPVCQFNLPAPIDLKATGVEPLASFPAAPSNVNATCGAAVSESIAYTIKNTGTAPLVLSGAVTGPFVLAAASQGQKTVAVNATVTLTITPVAPAIGTDRGGTTKTGGLVITTNEKGGKVYPSVPLSVKYHGANLEAVDVNGNVITAIALTAPTCPAPQTFSIRNSGDLTANAAYGSAPQYFTVFGGSAFTPAPIAPASSLGPITVKVFVTGPCSASGTLPFISEVPPGSGICVGLAAPLALTFAQTNGASACFCS